MNKLIAALLVVMFTCGGYSCPTQDDLEVSIVAAIEKLNEKAQSLDKRISALTVEEFFLAIDQWDRKEQPISDLQFKAFQELRKTRMLKSSDSLYPAILWRRDGLEGTTESRTVKLQLDLMTGQREGYGFVLRSQILEQRPYPPTARGYEWLVRPKPLKAENVSGRSFVYSVEIKPHLSVTMSRQVGQSRFYDLKAVAFDSNGLRHILKEDRIGQVSDTRMSKYVLQSDQPLPADIKSLGLEVLTQRGALYLSKLTVEAAARANKKVMPLPLVGAAFQFELDSTSGKPIKSSTLLGNVVVIDCWASWCGPCVGHIPTLKKLHEELAEDGLTIIGVSFDKAPEKAAAVYQSLKVPWPLIQVPEDNETRALWDESARVSSLPRILVLNRAGVLKTDTNRLPTETIRALMLKNDKSSDASESAMKR